MEITVEAATWVTVIAQAVNALVLAAYAYFTWGIWGETRRSAERTEALARQARDAFRLQVLIAYKEEARWAKEREPMPGQALGGAWDGVVLMEEALRTAFPEQWAEIQEILQQAAEQAQMRRGDQS